MKVKSNMLKYRNFCGIFAYSETDKYFIGRIMGITRPVTFKGNNMDDLKLAFLSAVDDYLFLCGETSIEPSKEVTVC